MFTGIVETMGTVISIKEEGTNKHFQIQSPITSELHEDQSVSHNGVCLTVTNVDRDIHWVTAIDETLKRSNLNDLSEGSKINLERCMKAGGRYDGHIVQGHVDLKAIVKSIEEQDGSWVYTFEYGDTNEVMVDKGSVTVNGVSLTCFDTHDHGFKVAIIPYTYEHTNFHQLKEGSQVNIEFDILGKYVQRLLEKRGSL
jgi:riboflavin synthase